MTDAARRTLPATTARRRGSAYVFVMAVCLIVTVLGMGAVGITNVSARATADGNDWEVAGTLAFSATEHAAAVVNAAAAANPTTWRSAYTSGQTAFTQIVGRGTMSWALKDETDGNLSADYLRAVRVYGVGTAGTVTRVYSVQLLPGGSPLDVLRTAIHSNGTVTLSGTTQAVNGPVSSNSNVTLGGTVKAAIEAKSTSGNASGTQTFTVPAVAKAMPSTTIYADLLPMATALNYNTISGGKIEKCLLSAASNPYGTTNPSGIYNITIPTNKTLTITNCRIVGTLLIDGTNVNVNVQGPVEWETGPAGGPILILNSPSGGLTLSGNNTWLSENSVGVNFNPPTTPFEGNSNTTKTDDIPPQFRGIVHVITGGNGNVQLNGNVYVVGTVIADCLIKTSGMATLVQDPRIYANPPLGYATGDVMTQLPGTWRWDAPP